MVNGRKKTKDHDQLLNWLLRPITIDYLSIPAAKTNAEGILTGQTTNNKRKTTNEKQIIMASFIFTKSGLMPIFVSFDPGYKNFSVSEGISENEGGKSWNVDILLKIDNPKEACNQLKQGIKIMTKSGIHYLVKIKRVFIIEKIRVFLGDEEIKGHEYIEFK